MAAIIAVVVVLAWTHGSYWFMLVFWLGTMPALWLAGTSAAKLSV